MPPPSRTESHSPSLIYDGECGVCRKAVELLRRWDREHVLRFGTFRQVFRPVKAPGLDMNIVRLGLVYDVEVEDGLVRINMTLTSPGCPAGPMITNDIYKVVRAIEGVKDVDIDIVWEPYWTPEKIDPKIRAMMGF